MQITVKSQRHSDEPASLGMPARTLADVRDMLLRSPEAETPETKLQLSAINTVSRALRCSPEDLPVDPARLRQQLSTLSPAMAGLTENSWSSVRSRILKALQRADVDVMASRRTKALSEQWAGLYQTLPRNGWQASVSRLIGYLSDRGIAPADVSDAVLGRFARDLQTTSLRGRPAAIVRGAIRGWNLAVVKVPGWPQQCLTLPEVQKDGYVLKSECFSPDFRKSLLGYLLFLTDPPEDDDAPFRGLKPSTLALREFQFRQMASALVHRGVPIEDITDLAVLTRREHVDLICAFFAERHGRPDVSQLNGLLAILRPLALHRLKDRELHAWIGRRLRRIFGGRTRRFGITEKNRRRLAVFKDPRHVRDLLLLPYRLLKRAESGALPAREAAILVRAAVAIELEIMCPIRLQNLSEIDVDRDLIRSRSGRSAVVHLFIPGKRTKNGEDIELELPPQTVALVDLYLVLIPE